MRVVQCIAEILIDEYQFGTCASLSLCNRQVHEATLPYLWKTVYLIAEEFSLDEVLYHYLWEVTTGGRGWKYTR